MDVWTNKLTSQVDKRVRLKDNIEMNSFGNIAQLSKMKIKPYILEYFLINTVQLISNSV